ncbi:MAG: sporulation protein YunB [Firmicutes bacterium]|nr:sporulation protein YunB [Bacillota bacterium]
MQLRIRALSPVFLRILIVFLFLAAVVFVIVDYRLKPTLLKIAEARANMIATSVINRAIHEKVARTMRYEDLYSIRQDNRGRVVLMQPNTGEINRLAAEATIQIQEALKNISEERIRIPLGQALGSHLLASMGPWISVRIVPIGFIEVDVTDHFEECGINQTRHKLYLDVTVGIKIVVPLVSDNVLVNAKLPISEGIILGDVPEVYFSLDELFGKNTTGSDEKINLQPRRVP